MNTHTLNDTGSMCITPNIYGKSTGKSTSGIGSNYKIVLTKPSPKQRPSGYTLADMIGERGKIDDKHVITTCIAILRTLLARMDEGGNLFPKNLTPSGIIFKENGGVEFFEADPEITLASRSDDNEKESVISGIPAYMSPESVTGLNEGSRSGIYTFGAIMYEMLTGHPPYDEGSPLNTIKAVKQGPPTRLAQVAPKTDNRLVAICERCMNRRVSCRYPSLFNVLSDLEHLQTTVSSQGAMRVKGWVNSMLSACF